MDNVIINDCINAINEGREIPARIKDFKIKYISTDGWRGYYKAEPTKKSGWVELDSDWVTGNWEDAPSGHGGSEVENKLTRVVKEIKKLGGEIRIVFLPTSNVFSTAYDVFIRGVEKATAERLLAD